MKMKPALRWALDAPLPKTTFKEIQQLIRLARDLQDRRGEIYWRARLVAASRKRSVTTTEHVTFARVGAEKLGDEAGITKGHAYKLLRELADLGLVFKRGRGRSLHFFLGKE